MTTTHVSALGESHRSDREAPRFKRHENLLDGATRIGPVDLLPAKEILDLLPSLPIWSVGGKDLQRRRLRGAQEILELLARYPSEGWQDRWLASGADESADWIAALVADHSATDNDKRLRLTSGMCCLLLCRAVLPGYWFLNSYQAQNLFIYTQQVLRPDLFTKMAQCASTTLGVGKRRLSETLATISKIVLHTGRDVDELTAEDLLTYRAWQLREYGKPRPGLTPMPRSLS